jgi:hypothetical protein
MIFAVFSYRACGKAERHQQENYSRNLQPELVQNASEGAGGGADRSEYGAYGAVAAGMVFGHALGHARRYAQLFYGGNFAHDPSILTACGATMTQTPPRTCFAADASKLSESSGGRVDQQLKQLMKELGDAINESLSDSEQISEVVARIKDGGYDIFLVLEATIGVSKQGEKTPEKTALVSTLSTNPEFKVSDQDLKFLKSLRIKIDSEKTEE